MYVVDALALGLLLGRGEFGRWWWLVFVLLLTPFYEWVVHKYILHADLSFMPKGFQDYWDKVHPGHHKDPAHVPLIFAPFEVAIQVPLSFFIIGLIIFRDFDAALVLFTATQSYYLFYEWMHLAHHLDFYVPRTKWGKALKRNHLLHHFKNERFWWGITNLIGDNILGTNPPPSKIPFSVTVKDIKKYHNLDSDMGH
jgi:hypothetical protein